LKKSLFAALAMSVTLAACGQSINDRCMEAANPKECVQVANAGGDVNDYLLYGMAGYMLSNAMNNGHRQTIIVQDPGYHGYRRPVQSYQTSRARVFAGKVDTTTTTTKRGLFGGTKQIVKTTSYNSTPKASWTQSLSKPSASSPRVTSTGSISSFGGGGGGYKSSYTSSSSLGRSSSFSSSSSRSSFSSSRR
jgi:hypothetical protein